MLKYQEDKPLNFSLSNPSTSDVNKKLTAYYSNRVNSKKVTFSVAGNHSYQDKIQNKAILSNYPKYSYKLDLEDGLPRLEKRPTISRHLVKEKDSRTCPYGDEPSLIACLKATNDVREIRNAYALSALRFELNPFNGQKSTATNKWVGIPTLLQPLYSELVDGKHYIDVHRFLNLGSLQELQAAVNKFQQTTKFWFSQELAPCMNANPLNPELHSQELSSNMLSDLTQYVQMQNSPYLFFDLMQGVEREVVTMRWRTLQSGQSLSLEECIVLVMTSWRNQGGQRRKKPIKVPIGVPLGYMQSIRRKNQPFITQEFSDHAHGGLNHWLQEHVWQRFYFRYPEKCRLKPSAFFKQLGYIHLAFADSIYELHMPNVVNPANTNFWSVLQYYLPLMSPWP